jgi:precorrin-2 C(20)-methyltransferase
VHLLGDQTVGRFWAVGVGPGDPELLTLKAVSVLRRADVLYHAGPQANQGRAWDIIRAHVRPEQEVRVVLTEPMSVVSAGERKAAYRRGVEQIVADCRRGRDVAFVTEGDPTLFSTAPTVWQLLAEMDPSIPIEIVPGVSSITAAAARVGWPLAQKDEIMAVVPASYHESHLADLLDAFPSVCLLKAAPALPQIEQALRRGGAERQAVYVENLGGADEWITHDLRAAVGRKNYFALVLVRRKPEAAAAQKERLHAAAARGKLCVVGLGPGDPTLLTGQAMEALKSAEVLVGYEGYLKGLAPLQLRAELHGSPIGAERQRARLALELAATGRRVALVSSGDAGVYGMSSLLLETAEAMPDLEIEMVPGVTAAVAAAALLGAPLGHDFACISLSDLLTPWDAIEQRLGAAGRGDFVLALYNPLSQRRTWQLPRARDILLQHRRPETPVGLVDKAHRPGMRVWHTTLIDLTAEGVGMETTLIIGNSQTRTVNGRLVTPRGYTDDRPDEPQPLGSDVSSPLAHARGSLSDVGQRIMRESFAIIERELEPHSLPPWALAVVRRMIHASADFDFAHTLRFSPDFEAAIREALRVCVPIITDTEMVLLGIRTALDDMPERTLTCLLNDPEAGAIGTSAGLTRSAAGIRLAARRYATPLLAIGNAPTALDEALRLVEEEGWRPKAIIGMPVGFIGVEPAKRRLLEQTKVPYLTCIGRKGGSAVTAAAVNALVEMAVSG